MEEMDLGRIDRRRFVKMAAIAGGGLFLVACAPAAAPPTPTPAPKAAAPPTPTPKPKLEASVDFAATAGGVGLHMMPLLVVEAVGYLKEEGITQKITAFTGGGDTVRGIVTGGQHLGHPAPTASVIAFSKGEPIRLIAENLPMTTIFWIAKADSPIKSMKDLKGRKLGYSRPGSISQTYAFSALRALGFKPDEDVELVAAGGAGDEMSAVKGGVIDVGWSVDPLLTQEVLKGEVKVVGSANEFIPAWSESMIATTEGYAKEHGDVLSAYLRAHVKAINFIKTSTEKAAELWGEGLKISTDIAKAAVKNYPIEKFTAQFDPAILKAISADMLANKQLEKEPQWDKVIDQSFLPPELRIKLT